MGDLFDLTGRTALVTGGGSGIGLALARGLARHGASVIVNGRDAAKAEAAAEGLRAEGRDARAAPFDVTDAEAVAREIARLDAETPLDILVNNAGITVRGQLETYDPADWNRVMAVQLTAPFLCARACAQRMIPRGRGKIVNIASATSSLVRAEAGAYSAFKGGVKNLTAAMAADWAKHGLNANAIAPGYFRTELNQALSEDPEFNQWLCARTPQGRWGELDELVGAAVYLSSDAASFVNGHMLAVDGGLTVTL